MCRSKGAEKYSAEAYSCFLKSIDLRLPNEERGAILEAMLREMRNGVNGETSCLAMTPSYIPVMPFPEKESRVIVVDAGGTNLRVSLVELGAGNACRILYHHAQPIPGRKRRVSAEQFFGEIAKAVLPVADESDKIGFCFSFPSVPDARMDSRIQKLDKEMQVDGMEGLWVGESLQKALEPLYPGHPFHIAVLNDTVAALLGTAACCGMEDFSGFAGVIVGTGYNCCYEEKRLFSLRETRKPCIVNMEAGSFHCLHQSVIDRELGAHTLAPDCSLMEKMIGGEYQGHLMELMIGAAIRSDLFSRPFAESFPLRPERVTSIDLTGIVTGSGNTPGLAGVTVTEGDRETLSFLASVILKRAAQLIAINLDAVARFIGSEPGAPLLIAMEGSIYQKNPVFREMVKQGLDACLTENRHIPYRCRSVENANLIGSAIASFCQ